MSVFNKKNMPPEVKQMGARWAKLAMPVVGHGMRQEKLAGVATGGLHESLDDIERWIGEECEYTERGLAMAAVDIQTLDDLRESGRLSDEDYDDLERWMAENAERIHRDYAALHDNVVEIDSHFDSEFIHKVESVFSTGSTREAIPFEDMIESLPQYANFGDTGREVDG